MRHEARVLSLEFLNPSRFAVSYDFHHSLAPPMPRSLRKLPMALISLVLVGYVVWSTDWSQVGAIVRRVSLPWLGLFALTAPALVWVSVWKWRRLLAVRGADVGFGTLFGLYIVGQFYNNLLPTSSGGDVVRAEVLRRRCGCGHTAYGSIVAERFTGLAMLIVLAVGALAATPALWAHAGLVVAAGAGLAFATAVMVVVVSRRVTRRLDRWFGHVGPARKALAKVHAFQDSLWEYARHPRELGVAVLLSLLFYGWCVVGTVWAAAAFGHPVSWWSVSVCVPLVLIVTLLPISLNGVGIWEATFAETFEALGLGRELGLAVALLLRARDLVWSLAGFGVLSVLGVARPGGVDADAGAGKMAGDVGCEV